MVNSIDAHFDHHKKIPLFFRKKVAGDLETLSRHLINVSQDLRFVARAKIPYIHNIFADDTRNFVLKLRWMRVIAADIGSQKVSDQQSIECLRWIRPRYADDNRALTSSRKDVPNAVLFYGEGIRNCISVI